MHYSTSAGRDTLFAISSALSTRVFAGTRALAATAAFAAALAGCSGGAGPAVERIRRRRHAADAELQRPAPNTPDVQSFKINLWENIRPQNRCGTCHSVEGGQTPMFARSDDVNLAYAAANSVVTLTSPKDSMMVAKVGGGHNCWLASNSTCATILTTWITNWAGELASSGGRQITLEAPALRDPGSSKNYPDDQVYSTRARFIRSPRSSARTATRRARRSSNSRSSPKAACRFRTRRAIRTRSRSRTRPRSRRSISTIRPTRASCFDCATSRTTAGRRAAPRTRTRCRRRSRRSPTRSRRLRSIRT